MGLCKGLIGYISLIYIYIYMYISILYNGDMENISGAHRGSGDDLGMIQGLSKVRSMGS